MAVGGRTRGDTRDQIEIQTQNLLCPCHTQTYPEGGDNSQIAGKYIVGPEPYRLPAQESGTFLTWHITIRPSIPLSVCTPIHYPSSFPLLLYPSIIFTVSYSSIHSPIHLNSLSFILPSFHSLSIIFCPYLLVFIQPLIHSSIHPYYHTCFHFSILLFVNTSAPCSVIQPHSPLSFPVHTPTKYIWSACSVPK